jgi:hypothetical protein
MQEQIPAATTASISCFLDITMIKKNAGVKEKLFN